MPACLSSVMFTQEDSAWSGRKQPRWAWRGPQQPSTASRGHRRATQTAPGLGSPRPAIRAIGRRMRHPVSNPLPGEWSRCLDPQVSPACRQKVTDPTDPQPVSTVPHLEALGVAHVWSHTSLRPQGTTAALLLALCGWGGGVPHGTHGTTDLQQLPPVRGHHP